MPYKVTFSTAAAILCVLFSGNADAQSPIITYQNYVNTNIVQNNNGQITGPVLNTALNNIIPIFSSMGTWNISGEFTLASTALPFPTALTLGGVKVALASAHQWAYGINSAGSLIFSQPAASDISWSGASSYGCSYSGPSVNVGEGNSLDIQITTSGGAATQFRAYAAGE